MKVDLDTLTLSDSPDAIMLVTPVGIVLQKALSAGGDQGAAFAGGFPGHVGKAIDAGRLVRQVEACRPRGSRVEPQPQAG